MYHTCMKNQISQAHGLTCLGASPSHKYSLHVELHNMMSSYYCDIVLNIIYHDMVIMHCMNNSLNAYDLELKY